MLNEMEYILAVWEERSFTRAAGRLYISQPALSAAVRRAEERLGVQIFDRNTRPVSVTPAGEKYIESALKIRQILAGMTDYFAALDTLQAGRVSIGTSDYFSSYTLPEIVRDFKKRYPQIDVELSVADPARRNGMLRDEAVDLLLCVEGEVDGDTAEAAVWRQEYLMLAVSKDDSVAQAVRKGRYTIADIKNGEHRGLQGEAASISVFSEKSFLSLQKQNDIYSRTLAICRDAGFEPVFDTGASLQITAYHMVRAGLGVAFVREELIRHVVDTNDVYLYAIDSPLVHRNISIAHKKNRSLPQAVQAMNDFLYQIGSI